MDSAYSTRTIESFSFSVNSIHYIIVACPLHQQGHCRVLKPGDDGWEMRMCSEHLELGFCVNDRQDVAERLHKGRQHIVVHFRPYKNTRSMDNEHCVEAILRAGKHLRYHSTPPIFPTIRDLSLCKESGNAIPLVKYHSGAISDSSHPTPILTFV